MAACTGRSIVLLIILLHFLESEQILYECVAEGEDAILPCEKVTPGQDQCDLTTWTFKKTSKILVAPGQHKSGNVNLTKNCSLQIKGVQTEDAGLYMCRQFDRSGEEFPQDYQVSLSVISMSKITRASETELKCSVSSNRRCVQFQPKWSVGDGAVKGDYIHRTVNSTDCWTSVKGPTSQLNSVTLQNFTCDMKCDKNKIQFHFRNNDPESPAEEENGDDDTDGDSEEDKPDTGSTEEESKGDGSEETQKNSEENGSDTGFKGWWWAVIGVAVFSFITLVAFITWRRIRVKATESNIPTGEEELSYAAINFGKDHKKTAIRGSEEAVTYSSVRIPLNAPSQLQASEHKQG